MPLLSLLIQHRKSHSWYRSRTIFPDLHLVGAAAGAVCLLRISGSFNGSRLDNITDWALDQFLAHYKKLARPITKDAIFHYVYAVLHDPVYREKYAQNLKREFPRIPFYKDFWRWADWGERLMALHIGYEAVEPWPLKRTDTKDEKAAHASLAPKVDFESRQGQRNYRSRQRNAAFRRAGASLGLQARQSLRARMDFGPI